MQSGEEPQELKSFFWHRQWDATHVGWNSAVQEEPLQHLMWTEGKKK